MLSVLKGVCLAQPEKSTRVRYLIIAILFAVSCFGYADRSALSQAAAFMPKGMNLRSVLVGCCSGSDGRTRVSLLSW